ncbi:MAG: acyl-CoA dehydrogenase family protein [Ectothiorhodospiraceae bacterium]|nr:acyl-CoA dehydrogenase family protein [Ectothiorhodospiraceae bacterium]
MSILDYSEEQRMLKDSTRRLLESHCSFKQRCTHMTSPPGYSKAAWEQMVEVGITSLPFPEDCGGFGSPGVEVAAVMEEIGRATALEPYLASIVLGGSTIARGADAHHLQEFVPAIIAGSMHPALALYEPDHRYALKPMGTKAQAREEGWILNGAKTMVLGGDSATHFLIPAKATDTTLLCLVPASTHGVRVQGYQTVGDLGAADIILEDVPLSPSQVICSGDRAEDAVEYAFDVGVSALCAEAVGTMERLLELTRDYLDTRKQFGVAIGSFQALQHQAVDLLVELEQCRSLSQLAARAVSEQATGRRTAMCSAAKAYISRSARVFAQQAIQLHGGIALTDEYEGSHLARRLTLQSYALGDEDFHLQRYARQPALSGNNAWWD